MKINLMEKNAVLLHNQNWSINIKASKDFACCEINKDVVYCHKGHTLLSQFMYLKEIVLKLYNKNLCQEDLWSYGIDEDSFNHVMENIAETLQDAYEFDCSTGYSRAFNDGYYTRSHVLSNDEAQELLDKISIPFSLS